MYNIYRCGWDTIFLRCAFYMRPMRLLYRTYVLGRFMASACMFFIVGCSNAGEAFDGFTASASRSDTQGTT